MRPADVMAETINPPDSVYTFSELKLHAGFRINRWEDKAGFYHLFNYDPVVSPESSPASVIDPATVIDLTPGLSADGSIEWKVPTGNWTIMRFGYSLTGSKNRPAVPAGSGYEVDKLSREHTVSLYQTIHGTDSRSPGSALRQKPSGCDARQLGGRHAKLD